MQKRLELTELRLAKSEGLEFAVPGRRGRSAVVVRQHLPQRRELPRVHVGRSSGDVAQARHLEGTLEAGHADLEKAQLGASLGLRVTEPLAKVA